MGNCKAIDVHYSVAVVSRNNFISAVAVLLDLVTLFSITFKVNVQ